MTGVPIGHTSFTKAYCDFRTKYFDAVGYADEPEPFKAPGTVDERKANLDEWRRVHDRMHGLTAARFLGGLRSGEITAMYKEKGEKEKFFEPHMWEKDTALIGSLCWQHTPLEQILREPKSSPSDKEVYYIPNDQLRMFNEQCFPINAYPCQQGRLCFNEALKHLQLGIDAELLTPSSTDFTCKQFLPQAARDGRLSVNATNSWTGKRTTMTPDDWIGVLLCPGEGDVRNRNLGIEFTDLFFHKEQIAALVPEYEVQIANQWLASDEEKWSRLSDRHRQSILDQAGQPTPPAEIIPVYDELPAEAIASESNDTVRPIDDAAPKTGNAKLGRPSGTGSSPDDCTVAENAAWLISADSGVSFSDACRAVASSKPQQRSKGVKALRRLADIFYDKTPENRYSAKLAIKMKDCGIDIAWPTLKPLLTQVYKKMDQVEPN